MADFGSIPPAPAADTFVFDFAAQVGAAGTIISATWLVSVDPISMVADLSPGSRVLSAPTFNAARTSAMLGNMIADCLYIIQATVSISDGRVLLENASLQCRAIGFVQLGHPSIGRLLQDARVILNDTVPISGSVRYTDDDLFQAFNSALLETRAKRPDAFLELGLRTGVPMYGPGNENQLFPLDVIFYPLFVNYIVGRSELREDEMTQEGRAVVLLNKFVTGLLQVAS